MLLWSVTIMFQFLEIVLEWRQKDVLLPPVGHIVKVTAVHMSLDKNVKHMCSHTACFIHTNSIIILYVWIKCAYALHDSLKILNFAIRI